MLTAMSIGGIVMDEKVYLKFTDGRAAFIYKTEKLDIEKELNKLQRK